MTEALVLGGGGVGGIAWITGLLTGLAEAGNDVSGAGLLVGTSAGSTVAAQLGSGLSLPELYARQTEPALQSAEIMAEVNLETFAERMSTLLRDATTPPEVRRAVGKFALDAETVPEAERRAVIESRLPSHEWPARALKIVAVDAETGEPRVFDNDSGVGLVDAVTASCAVPGVWPPATVGGRRYVDGGIRSAANADLAAGATRVLVLAPLGDTEMLPTEVPLADAVEQLRAAGAEVAVVEPDETSRTAIGENPLDPATRRPAAEAGRAQGRALDLPYRR
ncbi:NTE family protein [Amycolatopsis bartoniae]|uniref:Patatin n=1 Tax=Amycolatopsis bartoniae TaxID=941986 RepID=A0A8H9ITJ2_9PSEU|nr:patatin-like phospholipase family protein [Amycolatopsis bartoniae]MBB2937705.1 NTE family protein [Amycolatopsis bartoniae]TVT08208.1 patatin-like phospholipase family protein [Amycolatopsis bartoniae]GHF40062.1 patatin [Amycolatopsis bartoniae]